MVKLSELAWETLGHCSVRLSICCSQTRGALCPFAFGSVCMLRQVVAVLCVCSYSGCTGYALACTGIDICNLKALLFTSAL